LDEAQLLQELCLSSVLLHLRTIVIAPLNNQLVQLGRLQHREHHLKLYGLLLSLVLRL
jgi:hypothetical protein